jgi:hypothetical protein
MLDLIPPSGTGRSKSIVSMKRSHFQAPLFVIVLFAAVLFGTGEAHARRGFKLITTGSTVDEIGTVKLEMAQAIKAETKYDLTRIGFQYSYFGLFWLDLWNWGGEYVIYDGNKDGVGEVITKEQAAKFMGVDESKVGKPFNYRFPYLLDIVVVGALLKIVPRIIAKKRQSAGRVPEFKQGEAPRWMPPSSPPAGSPPPAADIPPPMPPPLPPEEK